LQPPPEAELRALDLFERLMAYPGNARFRERLLKRESAAVMACLARIEAGHAARAAMPTEMPDWMAGPLVEPPGQIGPFRLTERIGHGGMGDVWRGARNDGLFEQTVAIKLIHRHLSAGAAKAFEAERRILAKLDHPDIVRLTDGGATEDGLHYLIMDYVDGVPFDEAVAPLPIDQRIRLFRQAAATVQFAHSRLIAHADLKPSNILVDREGRVRLLDFGIAGLLSGDGEAVPPTGAMTREFASPQRLAGAPPSIADDVYALGRMLALIVGPVDDGDPNAIIAKASAAEEADRYGTVAALSADLEAWQNGFPVAAGPDSWTYRARKFVARNRAGVTASALAIFALIGTTTYATVSAIRAERAR
jgi:eukaryotic-like serine/threonine-protein kinase